MNGDADEGQKELPNWIRLRNDELHDSKGAAAAITVFQEDLQVVAVGERTAKRAAERIPQLMARLGVVLSDKRDANRPFSTPFDAIGASYDTADARHPSTRPSAKPWQQ